MGYDAAFVGTGAGSPKFAGIPGEAFNGVFSANEFLTRVNLMRGHRQPIYDTPVGMGKRVAVVGAGNTAMDSARVAMRMGAESVTVVYRRSRRESPARVEELEHAIEEGIHFNWLTLPVEILGDSRGWVTGMRCRKMELGEPDASGRRRPVEVPGSDFLLDVDTVIYALGTTANPIISQTTPGLQVNQWGYIEVDERTNMTSIRRRNIDVTTAADGGLTGATDVAHLEFAASSGRVVVTQDDDFLRLHAQGATHAGIAYCQQQSMSAGGLRLLSRSINAAMHTSSSTPARQ